jgi:hypothetical protein
MDIEETSQSVFMDGGLPYVDAENPEEIAGIFKALDSVLQNQNEIFAFGYYQSFPDMLIPARIIKIRNTPFFMTQDIFSLRLIGIGFREAIIGYFGEFSEVDLVFAPSGAPNIKVGLPVYIKPQTQQLPVEELLLQALEAAKPQADKLSRKLAEMSLEEILLSTVTIENTKALIKGVIEQD